jgi:hypothetical protein
MMVRVPINQCSGIVIYLVAITGISLLGTKLSSIVANQAIGLALPYLDNGPPKLSLIELRRIDAMQAAQPLPGGTKRRVTALEAPSVPATILAARLDLAEKADLGVAPAVASESDGVFKTDSQPSSIATRVTKHRIARSNSSYVAVATTRDIFNRSFGVITVAAK